MMIKLFLLVFSCSAFVGANADGHHFIESPQVTDFGTWGSMESCPEDQFVIGMQLKVERSDGWKDDTALNGIRFFCSKLGEGVSGEVDSKTQAITSSVGVYGIWKNVQLCGDSGSSQTSGVVGFQLRSEKNKGGFDDTAANNLRMICSDFGAHHLNDRVVQGEGSPWGDWTAVRQCQRGYSICGLMTQVEGNMGDKVDDTALNNLKAKCCKVKLVELEKEVVMEEKPSLQFPNPAEFAKSYKDAIQRPRAEEKETVAEMIPTTTEPSSTTTESPTISTTTSTEAPTPTLPAASSTEQPAAQLPSLTSAEKDDEARYREKILSEELKKLSQLEFGASESTYTVEIPSDESVSVDDIQEANPIVPPHVIQTAAHATDADNEDSQDPDPSKVEYISGTIITPTSTSPTISSEEEEESTPAAVHKKLESSNSGSSLSFRFETLSLTLMYLIVWVLSI